MTKDKKLGKGLWLRAMGEILSVIATILVCISVVLSNPAVIVTFDLVAIVLYVVVAVFSVVGLFKIKHGNRSYSIAFWFFIVTILISITCSILKSIAGDDQTAVTYVVAEYLNIVCDLSNFVIGVFVLDGTAKKLKEIGDVELAKKTEKVIYYFAINIALCNVIRFLSNIFEGTLNTVVTLIFLVIILVTEIAGYIGNVVVLLKASKRV